MKEGSPISDRIRFGGPGVRPSAPGWPTGAVGDSNDLEFLLQHFFHYAGKIWLLENDLPQDADGLARFDTSRTILDYRRYRTDGGEVPLDDGLDVEESFLLAQLVVGKPLSCLLNSAMPETPTARIGRVIRLEPDALLDAVRKRWPVAVDTRQPVKGQIDRWGALAPAFTTLVYDGFTGHCILLRGVERGTGRILYWDPWPLRSVLCAENNEAGANAELIDEDSWMWALEPDAMARVLFAVFVPAG